MYKRKIPVDPNCGISVAMEVIISKWNLHILAQINRGVTRPKDLVKVIPDITKRVLHDQMKQLEFYKIVDRITYLEVPLRVEYSLTEEGRKVLVVLNQVYEWGMNFSPQFKEIRGCDR